jgi:chromate transport protein ChrA
LNSGKQTNSVEPVPVALENGDELTIGQLKISKEEFTQRLSQAQKIPGPDVLIVNGKLQLSYSPRFAAAAGVYFIPGVGEIAVTVTGAVLIGGVAIWAGSWLGKKIASFFKTHTKNARTSTHDKHTEHRAGGSKKKKTKSSWTKRAGKSKR